jgi:Zn-dependent M28 family amino/carboxypeptidase
VKIAVAAIVVLLLIMTVAWRSMMGMPGRSWRGTLPPLSESQRAIAAELRRDVLAIASGEPRSVPETLAPAAAYIERELIAAGYKPVRQQTSEGDNIEAELRGESNELVIIGAHYDSVDESPGTDDNASGVAGCLAIARRIAHSHPHRTLRFVFFVAEEPPNFKSPSMGSYVYAKRCHERGEQIAAMLSIESIGYYDTRPDSQVYPAFLAQFFPSTGDFIGFAGNSGSRALIRQCVGAFRKHAKFPSEGAAVPELVEEIGWSDQWSFWQFGWPALMVTDTAPFRNPNYHRSTDTPETLDYERTARVVEGLVAVTRDLSSSRA